MPKKDTLILPSVPTFSHGLHIVWIQRSKKSLCGEKSWYSCRTTFRMQFLIVAKPNYFRDLLCGILWNYEVMKMMKIPPPTQWVKKLGFQDSLRGNWYHFGCIIKAKQALPLLIPYWS